MDRKRKTKSMGGTGEKMDRQRKRKRNSTGNKNNTTSQGEPNQPQPSIVWPRMTDLVLALADLSPEELVCVDEGGPSFHVNMRKRDLPTWMSADWDARSEQLNSHSHRIRVGYTVALNGVQGISEWVRDLQVANRVVASTESEEAQKHYPGIHHKKDGVYVSFRDGAHLLLLRSEDDPMLFTAIKHFGNNALEFRHYSTLLTTIENKWLAELSRANGNWYLPGFSSFGQKN